MKRNAKKMLMLLCIVAIHACICVADDRTKATTRSVQATSEVQTGLGSSEKLDYAPPTWPETPDTGALLLRLTAGTVTVLVLCVVTLLAGRRWLRGPAPKIAAGSQLQILETVSLGNRCCVHLLRAGQHQIVVGTDGTGMKSLVALPESFEGSLRDAEGDEIQSADTTSQQLIPVGA